MEEVNVGFSGMLQELTILAIYETGLESPRNASKTLRLYIYGVILENQSLTHRCTHRHTCTMTTVPERCLNRKSSESMIFIM